MLSISLLILLSATDTTAASKSEAKAEAKEFGAVMAPAVMPSGSNSLYGFIGGPDVGIGYRQGFSAPWEFETLARFNFLQVSVTGEAGFRAPIYRDPNDPSFVVSAAMYFGLTYNSGTTYFDRANFRYLGATARANVLGTYRLNSVLYLLAKLEVPLMVPLTAQGLSVAPTGGAGIEVRVGDSLSLLAFGSLGGEVRKEPLGVLLFRPAWQLQFGVGTRFF